MKRKIVDIDNNKIISLMPAEPGIVAVYSDYAGGPDFEVPVLAWGVFEVLEENPEEDHDVRYNTVRPLTFEYDINSLDDATNCDNFLGVRGGRIGTNSDLIEEQREAARKRREELHRAIK